MTEPLLKDLIGPGTYEKWAHWKYSTEAQSRHSKIKTELDQILSIHPVNHP